jgi:hypothetical protein
MKNRFLPCAFLGAATIVAGCAHEPELKPSVGAQVLPNQKDVAVAEVAGVQLSVAGDVWKGLPSTLPEVITPLRASVQNQSGRSLRISYQDFALIGSSGFRYVPLPPFSIRGTVNSGLIQAAPAKDGALAAAIESGMLDARVSPYRVQKALAQQASEGRDTQQPARQTVIVNPRFSYDRFFVAPHFAYLYPGLEPWPWAFGPAYDPFYYGRYYGLWPVQLPTQDMLEQALPEGVVESDGSVSGFLYFPAVGKREEQVTFEMKLVDAKTAETFGTARIPFLVKR